MNSSRRKRSASARRSWLIRIVTPLVAVLCGLLTPGTAGAVPPLVCGVTVLPAGEGQWVRYRPVENGQLAYQLHAGQSFFVFNSSFDAIGVRWRIPESQSGQMTPYAVPMINMGTMVRYVRIDACDNGCGPYVCRRI